MKHAFTIFLSSLLVLANIACVCVANATATVNVSGTQEAHQHHQFVHHAKQTKNQGQNQRQDQSQNQNQDCLFKDCSGDCGVTTSLLVEREKPKAPIDITLDFDATLKSKFTFRSQTASTATALPPDLPALAVLSPVKRKDRLLE